MKMPLTNAHLRPRTYPFATLLMGLLLLITACGGVTTSSASTPTHAPTAATNTPTAMPTATPPPPLPFHPVTLPAGYVQQNFALAVSPLDGRVAWACAASGGSAYRVWLTTDEGGSWQVAGTLSPTTPQQGSCAMTADWGNPQAAVFTVTWGGGEAGDLGARSLYTADGGTHWTQLTGWTAATAADTFGATVYAMLTITTPISGQKQSASVVGSSPPKFCAPCSTPTTQQQYEFVVSHDGLHSWTAPHADGAALNYPFGRFWNDAANGTVYAASEAPSLWQGTNAGATWTKLATPEVDVTLAARSATSHSWTFCGTGSSTDDVQCSADTGASWHAVSTLQATITCASCPAKGAVGVQTYACAPDGIESDGTLIAICALESDGFTPASYTAYRLATGATTWEALGGVPYSGCVIAPNNIIWCMNEQGDSWMTAILPA